MDSTARASVPTLIWLLFALLMSVGFVARTVPLLDDQRMMEQWPTEDGYFMLTMGRNVGIGRGLSVRGGDMPTNGTQPLTTFVWAAGYAMLGPERSAGVLFAQILQLIAGLFAAFVLFRLTRTLGKNRSPGERDVRALLAAGIWYASPQALHHTMNCLETCFNALVVLLIAWMFVSDEEEEKLWSFKRCALFGVLLGIGFWARNDSALVILGACLAYLAPALKNADERMPRFTRVLFFGSVSVVVASPWLIYNYSNFGHIMPVSGRAEALTGHFASNLGGVPIVLAEFMSGIFPIPSSLSGNPAVIAGATLVVVAGLALLVRSRSTMSSTESRMIPMIIVYTLGLVAFYGLYFGAAWFLPRYFLPLSPFLVIGLVSAVIHFYKRFDKPALAFAAATVLVGVTLALTWRTHQQRQYHQHFQVVRWLEENVPDDTYVGAIQTGTIGFFHDRTINLDGKVNQDALNALLEGREGEYVVNDTEIAYLADWTGMRDWMNKPAIAANFDVLVFEEEQNLCVLRRRSATP